MHWFPFRDGGGAEEFLGEHERAGGVVEDAEA